MDDDARAAEPTAVAAGTSLREVLEHFADEGWDGQFDVDDETGGVTCAACGTQSPPDAMTVTESRRLEGASDPADMAHVLAVPCPSCGRRGVVISRYGPEASPGESALLRATRAAGERRDPR